eukprot:TRINITY_DN2642_c0_g1_i1.p1 TRINITY_DN2642_c0_g1~~TRINITY_DN2642_c0_g1_i1.p1  ORF type:complete len:184 (-),score=34.91 TRINITY_DN2642_c0_g1_i1:252-803(-)
MVRIVTFGNQCSRSLKYAPRIYCEIFDEDIISKDTSLGRFSVSPEHIWKVFSDLNDNLINDEDEENVGNQPSPIWYNLENAQQESVSGEILCAFELIDVKQGNFEMPIVNPPCRMEKQWLHCCTLGLREIQSTFGVNKSFIEFEINGYNVIKPNDRRRPNSRNPKIFVLKFLKFKSTNYLVGK